MHGSGEYEMTHKTVELMMSRDKFIVTETIKSLTSLKVREALVALNGVTTAGAANDLFYDVVSH